MSFVGGTILEFAIIKYIYYLSEKRYEELLKMQNFKADLRLDEIDLPEGLIYWEDQKDRMNGGIVRPRRRVPKVPSYPSHPSLDAEKDKVKVEGLFTPWQTILSRGFNGFKAAVYRVHPRPLPEQTVHLKSMNALMREETSSKNGKKQADLHNTIDRFCRVAFPATFLLFNVIYWPMLLLGG